MSALEGVYEFRKLIKSQRDLEFFDRVWVTPESVYRSRLQAIGFQGLNHVLDAGAGFGQWTIPLAKLNCSVVALEPADNRRQVLSNILSHCKCENVQTTESSIEQMSFKNNVFDGIFCYSVIYLCAFEKALKEMARVLRPGGFLYLNTNGLGWYVYNLMLGHNSSKYFSSRRMALNALINSFKYFVRGNRNEADLIIPRSVLLKELNRVGFRVVEMGPDGSIRKGSSTDRGSKNSPSESPEFFPAKRFGLTNVYEVLCRKEEI